MNLGFTVRDAAFRTLQDLNAIVLVLSEFSEGEGKTIEFQRSIEVDDQDVAMGMDTYCICWCAGATYYGGIENCAVTFIDPHLELAFSADAARKLGLPGSISFPLEVDAKRLREITTGLEKIVGVTLQ